MIKETREKLIAETVMSNASVDWWKAELKKVESRLLYLDSHGLTSKLLQGKLAHLIQKGEFECRVKENLRQRAISLDSV